MFVALALSLNLAMWLDFVFCSLYSIQSKFDRYLIFRTRLFVLLVIYSIVVVVLPAAVFSYFDCSKTIKSPMTLYVSLTFSFFAIVTPIVGVVLLKIIKEHFPDFYLVIHLRTKLLVICQGAAYSIRGLFGLIRFSFNHAFINWFNASVENNTWGAAVYVVSHMITE